MLPVDGYSLSLVPSPSILLLLPMLSSHETEPTLQEPVSRSQETRSLRRVYELQEPIPRSRQILKEMSPQVLPSSLQISHPLTGVRSLQDLSHGLVSPLLLPLLQDMASLMLSHSSPLELPLNTGEEINHGRHSTSPLSDSRTSTIPLTSTSPSLRLKQQQTLLFKTTSTSKPTSLLQLSHESLLLLPQPFQTVVLLLQRQHT